MTVVSPVIVVVAEASLYPPSSPVEGRVGSIVWSLKLRMLILATIVAPPPGSNLATGGGRVTGEFEEVEVIDKVEEVAASPQ